MKRKQITLKRKNNGVLQTLTTVLIIVAMFVSIPNIVLGSRIFYYNHIKTEVIGYYNVGSERIVLYPDRAQDGTLDQVFFHEKCHYYWYTKLNNSQQDVYNDIYLHATYFVSPYAASELEEDFAETCYVYILSLIYTQTDPKIDFNRLSFMKNLSNLFDTQNIYYLQQ